MTRRSVRYPEGHLLYRNLRKDYPLVSHGKGLSLFDKEGKEYLDASGGALVVSVGHGNEEISQAIAEQMKSVAYVNGMQFVSEGALEFSERLCKLAPKGLNRVTMLNSGSEASEAAIKFVRQYWVERGQTDKKHFIARAPGYHGNTLFALSASARPSYKKMFAPLLADVPMIPAPQRYHSAVKDYDKEGADYYAGKLEECILKLGAKNVAAFMVEPVSGSSTGAQLPPPGYFEKIQAICRKHDVLIIADEVMCGAGRTGKFFACEHFGLEPDLIVMGKAINGGYAPLSVVLMKDEHVRALYDKGAGYMHAQTYMQNPMCVAAGLAILRYYEKHKTVENAAKVGGLFQKLLQSEIAPLKYVGAVSGIGMMAGVEFIQDKNAKKPFARSEKIVEQFVEHAFAKGLIVWPNVGHVDEVNGDLVMLGPPLNITEDEAKKIVKRLRECIESFAPFAK